MLRLVLVRAFSDLTTGDMLSLLVAGYAAVVSTLVGVRQFIRDRPRVKVFLTPITDATSPDAGLRDLWAVRVVNTRDRQIDCLRVGLTRRAREYDQYIPTPVGLGGEPPSDRQRPPVALKAGEHTTFPFARELNPGSVKGAWVRDSLDREHVARFPRHTPRGLYHAWKLRRAWCARGRGDG